MNKKVLGLMLSGMIIGSSVTAFAAGGRKIEVFDEVKKIVVNKITKPFNSSNAPFTYKGTTYVPLRYISEALGENVDWDGKTGTVYIGDRYSSSAKYWEKDIKHMAYGGGSYSYWDNNIDSPSKNNISEEFSNYLELYETRGNDTSYIEFPLNGQFKKFTSRLGLMHKYMNCKEVEVKIFLDGKVAYKTTLNQGGMPKNISIDLTGANKIKFYIKVNDSNNYGGVVFGDGQFIKK